MDPRFGLWILDLDYEFKFIYLPQNIECRGRVITETRMLSHKTSDYHTNMHTLHTYPSHGTSDYPTNMHTLHTYPSHGTSDYHTNMHTLPSHLYTLVHYRHYILY